jgi:hypothetical protein
MQCIPINPLILEFAHSYKSVHTGSVTAMPTTTQLENAIPFWKNLFTFQQEGVKFGIQKKGRCLIADDMGLGTCKQLFILFLYDVLVNHIVGY